MGEYIHYSPQYELSNLNGKKNTKTGNYPKRKRSETQWFIPGIDIQDDVVINTNKTFDFPIRLGLIRVDKDKSCLTDLCSNFLILENYTLCNGNDKSDKCSPSKKKMTLIVYPLFQHSILGRSDIRSHFSISTRNTKITATVLTPPTTNSTNNDLKNKIQLNIPHDTNYTSRNQAQILQVISHSKSSKNIIFMCNRLINDVSTNITENTLTSLKFLQTVLPKIKLHIQSSAPQGINIFQLILPSLKKKNLK